MHKLLEKGRVVLRRGYHGTVLPKGRAVSMCYHSGKLLIKHVRQQCTPVHSYTIGFPGSALDLALPDDKNLL